MSGPDGPAAARLGLRRGLGDGAEGAADSAIDRDRAGENLGCRRHVVLLRHRLDCIIWRLAVFSIALPRS